MTADDLRAQVRERYAAAATTVLAGGSNNDALLAELTGTVSVQDSGRAPDDPGEGTTQVDGPFGSALYSVDERGALPAAAVAASLGCGNPTVVADLRAGECVLDLGSGGGIDVLLSARRVGETGFAYGVDMTDEMLDLARSNQARADVANVEFLKGTIEDVPLPEAAVDVVISNCVVNLSVDKSAVLREIFRVLKPGGRVGISDVVAEDRLSQTDRVDRGSNIGCISGALSTAEYIEGLAAAGFVDVDVRFTHEVAPGLHSAVVRAIKPAQRG
jgi:SAM-dependent methyltransferase